MQMVRYTGMSVEQRLLMSGMNFCFGEAAEHGDRLKMIEILIALQVARDCAARFVAEMLAGPASVQPG
jgi:hypothetical protein